MYDSFITIFGNNVIFRDVVLLVFGLLIGSFLNVVVYRLPIMLQYKWQTECSHLLGHEVDIQANPNLNLFFPGSHCPECKIKVPFWANVPILSYLFLRGRCFNCKTRIPLRYPGVELITALLFVAAGYVVSDMLLLLGFMIFSSIVICIVIIDYDTFILPDELTLPLLWLGLLANLNGLFAGSLANSVLGAVTGYMSLWLIYWGFKLFTGRDGMGYGDFKFLAAILAWTGYRGLIPITLVAAALGIIYFVFNWLLARQADRQTSTLNQELPFGPFLGAAGLLFIFAEHYYAYLPW